MFFFLNRAHKLYALAPIKPGFYAHFAGGKINSREVSPSPRVTVIEEARIKCYAPLPIGCGLCKELFMHQINTSVFPLGKPQYSQIGHFKNQEYSPNFLKDSI